MVVIFNQWLNLFSYDIITIQKALSIYLQVGVYGM